MNLRVVRVIHVAFIAGVVSVFLILALVRDRTAMTAPALPVPYVRVGAAVLAAATVIAHRIVRAAVPALGGTGDAEQWWAANIGRVMVRWAVADGLAVVGAVLWLLTGDFVTLAIAGGVGLFLLIVAHPGRLVRP